MEGSLANLETELYKNKLHYGKTLNEKDGIISEMEEFQDKVFDKNKKLAVKALTRIINSSLYFALITWKNIIQEEIRKQSVMERFVRK